MVFMVLRLGGFLEAQRAFMCSERRFRPAAVSPRFFVVAVADVLPGGRPRRLVGAGAPLGPVPLSASSARSMAFLCCSSCAMILSTPSESVS
jgi:hypothetical protein